MNANRQTSGGYDVVFSHFSHLSVGSSRRRSLYRHYRSNRGAAAKFSLGGGGFIGTQTHLPHKFSFSLDFCHFIYIPLKCWKMQHLSRKSY